MEDLREVEPYISKRHQEYKFQSSFLNSLSYELSSTLDM